MPRASEDDRPEVCDGECSRLHVDQRSDGSHENGLASRPLHCVPHDPERDGGKRCASPPSMFSGEKERREARQELRDRKV